MARRTWIVVPTIVTKKVIPYALMIVAPALNIYLYAYMLNFLGKKE